VFFLNTVYKETALLSNQGICNTASKFMLSWRSVFSPPY